MTVGMPGYSGELTEAADASIYITSWRRRFPALYGRLLRYPFSSVDCQTDLPEKSSASSF
jgi:hypothetical protein